MVVNCVGDLPVYIVRLDTKKGPTRTLHRDLLLPCGFLSGCTTEDLPEDLPARKVHTRSQSRNHAADLVDIFEDEDGEYAEPAILGSSSRLPMKFSMKRAGEQEPLTPDIVGSTLSTASSDSDFVLPSPQSLVTRSSIAILPENHLPEVEESRPISGEGLSMTSCGVDTLVGETAVEIAWKFLN